MSQTDNSRIQVARITGAFGTRGTVRAILFSDNLKSYPALFRESGDPVGCKIIKYIEKNKAVLSLDGVSDRTSAESLKGEFLYASKGNSQALQNNEFYVCDLIGKQVKIIGNDLINCHIINILNFGAGDLIEISYENISFLVPFTEENFPNSQSEICMTSDAWNWYKD